MFRNTLQEIVFIYLGACLLLILLSAYFYNSRRTNRERKAFQKIFKCRVCSFEFPRNNTPIARCPNCDSNVEYRKRSLL